MMLRMFPLGFPFVAMSSQFNAYNRAKLMAKLGFKLTEGNNLSMPKLDESANGAMAKLTLTRGWIETGLMALYWRERTTCEPSFWYYLGQ